MEDEHSFTFTTRAGAIDAPPIAKAGEDQEVDQHELVAFDGRASTDDAGIVNWTWRFVYDDQSYLLHGPVPTFTFDHVGKVEVSLTVRDADDLESTDHMFVTVRDKDAPVAIAGADVTVDQHRKVVLDGSTSDDNVGIVYYEWTFVYNGSLTTLSGPTHIFQFDTVGVYEVTLTVGDAMGNTGNSSLNVTVRDVEPPIAVSGGDMTVREGTTVTLNGTASSDNVEITVWNWTIERRGKVERLEGPTVVHRFSKPGRYLVNLTVEDGVGLTASDSFYITVKEKDDGPGFGLLLALISLAVAVVLSRDFHHFH
jgi:PKD repeat protein